MARIYEKKIDLKEYFAKGIETVGAVAIDVNGKLSAGTSTGGVPNKLAGRIGDVPILGAGAYANNSLGAASVSGHGEAIMRVLLTKTACDLMRNKNAQEAVEIAIKTMHKKVEGYGGIIAIDRKGNIGIKHNTPNFVTAFVNGKMKKTIASI